MSKLSKALAAISAGAAYFFVTASVYAASAAPLQAPKGSIDTDIDATSIPQLVINLLFGLAIFLTIAYMMYGGIRWITSRGDKIAVESARKQVAAALIGLIVVAGTFFILQVLFTVLGADNPLKDGFKIPTLKDVAKPSPN